MDYTILPFKGIKPLIQKEVLIASGARIIGDVHIENFSSIWFNVTIRADVNYIRIGEKTNIQDGTVIHVQTNGHPTIIGNRVTVGHKAMLHACSIGDLSLVGMGAIILDGAEIPERCIVGAGTLITQNKKFSPNSLIIDNKEVRKLNEKELQFLEYSAEHYWEIAQEYR